MAAKKWEAYVISLNNEEGEKRWIHMQNEFKDTVLNLNRFLCEKSKNGRGWAEVGCTYAEVMKKHNFDISNNLCIVLEDDCFRLQDKETFNKRCEKIFKYLEDHEGSYSHFQGGGVYPQPISIESKDPLLIRCNYITCTTFTVFGKEARDKVFEYCEKINNCIKDNNFEQCSANNKVNTPIDNYIGLTNKGKMLAPYPHLVWQVIGIPSNISSKEQKNTLNDAFSDSHKEFTKFVRDQKVDCNLFLQNGGSKKKRAKTLSFLQSAMRKHSRIANKIKPSSSSSSRLSYGIRHYAQTSKVKSK